MNDDWETPDWLMEHFDNHYDPCPTFRQEGLKLKFVDGLKTDWESPAFVNPPYSKPLPWVKKAVKEAKKGISVVMLLRVDPSTKWYKLLMEHGCHVAFFNERVRFKGTTKPPNFA